MTVVTSVPLSSPSKSSRWRKSAVVARYEYSMQVRRPALWLVIVALVGLRSFRPWPASLDISTTALSPLIGDWAIDFMMLTPVGVGILLADRGRREALLGLQDMLGATPTGIGPRWWGKALGATAATLTPVAVCWTVLLLYLATQRGATVIPLGVGAFAAALLPGLLFVSAFSLAVPLLIGAPLYRLAFIGYWLWGNLVGPQYGIPTLSGTPFDAIGEYPVGAWFHGHMFDAADRHVHASTGDALLSIAFLLVAALAVLVTAHLLLRRRSAS